MVRRPRLGKVEKRRRGRKRTKVDARRRAETPLRPKEVWSVMLGTEVGREESKPESVPKPKRGSTPKCESTPERGVEEMPHLRSREQTKTARGGFASQQTNSPDLRVTDIDLQKPANSLSVATAQNGDTVSVHYVGKFPGGKVFDTSMRGEAEKSGLFNPARDYKPLQVVLGKHQVIGGFEEALMGMKVNETKEVTLPPEKAYGKTGRHPMAGKTLQFKLLVTNIKKSS